MGRRGKARRVRVCLRLAAAIAASCAICGCASFKDYVQVRDVAPAATLADDLASIATDASLSRYSRELLAQQQISWRPENCDRILVAVGDAPAPLPARLFALTEIALAGARSRACPLPHDQLLLNAARLAYGQLVLDWEDEQTFPEHLIVSLYNRAVSELLAGGGHGGNLAKRAAALGITLEPASADLATRFDRVLDADSLAFTGFVTRHRRFGIGAAFVGVIDERPDHWKHARAMDGGYAQAITVLLDFDEDGTATLQVVDSSTPEIIAGDRTLPLHADFTAPYAWQLDQVRRRPRGSGQAPPRTDAATDGGLLLLEPFDPGRIPLLMINGEWTSPQPWRDVTNEILATPQLRRKYQVWNYFSPTGADELDSNGTLRIDLTGFIAELRAAYGSGAVQPLVVVGKWEPQEPLQ